MLSEEGIHYKKGNLITNCDPVTGELTNSELLADELNFDIDNFNRQVVNENFNRVVLEEIAADINPEGAGKTLIFAVDDKHADLIVQILKELYTAQGISNDAITKITGSIGDKERVQDSATFMKVSSKRTPTKRNRAQGNTSRPASLLMLSFDSYVRDHTDNFFDLPEEDQLFETELAFTGCELVHDTHHLALMNEMLHGLNGKTTISDTLSEVGKSMKNFDLILSNPPFGTKKCGERATRDDLTFPTSNKQLNFLQHFYHSLKPGGRATVVLPDNVLFADGDGERIRVDLMNKCNLHTVLRLPTGIFYA